MAVDYEARAAAAEADQPPAPQPAAVELPPAAEPAPATEEESTAKPIEETALVARLTRGHCQATGAPTANRSTTIHG